MPTPNVLKAFSKMAACMALVVSLTTLFVAPALSAGMDKLKIFDAPVALPEVTVEDENGAEVSWGEFEGQALVVNLWATWCAPCIVEMPTLVALQERLGSEAFSVIALSQDRAGTRVAKPFLETNGWESLPLYIDPKGQFAKALGVRGLPTTLVINAEGKEVARLEGHADWNSEEAYIALEGLLGSAAATNTNWLDMR